MNLIIGILWNMSSYPDGIKKEPYPIVVDKDIGEIVER